MSRDVGVILFAYGLGFLAAIPVGASQVEVVKRALARRYGAALLSAAGTVTSDMMYGCLALFGVARFLDSPSVLTRVQWAAGTVLVALSVLTWRQSRQVFVSDEQARWTGGGISYLTGLTIGLSYPPIMLSWLMGMTFVKGIMLVDSFRPSLAIGFVLAGGAGLYSYMAVLTLIVRRTHHSYDKDTIRHIYRGLSILLATIALAFFINGALRLLTSRAAMS